MLKLVFKNYARIFTYFSKICVDHYYLCDNRYTNSSDFLTPYRGIRYHLNEWGANAQRLATWQEYYNMRHTRVRNVIERAFGILKIRWGILRCAVNYPIRT